MWEVWISTSFLSNGNHTDYIAYRIYMYCSYCGTQCVLYVFYISNHWCLAFTGLSDRCVVMVILFWGVNFCLTSLGFYICPKFHFISPSRPFRTVMHSKIGSMMVEGAIPGILGSIRRATGLPLQAVLGFCSSVDESLEAFFPLNVFRRRQTVLRWCNTVLFAVVSYCCDVSNNVW